MSDKRILYRKRLGGTTLYDFCPYCVKARKEAGEDYHTLPPLFEFKTVEWDKAMKSECVSDTQWECPVCKKITTMQTFMDFYVAK